MVAAAAVLAVVMVVVPVPGAEAQMSLGPGGFGLPPINIVSVFKFVRDFFLALLSPAAASPAKISEAKTTEVNSSSPAAVNGTKSTMTNQREEKSGAEATTREPYLADLNDSDDEVTIITVEDHEPRIVEKFDAGCEEDDNGDCLEAPSPAAKDGLITPNVAATSAALLGRWPVGYIVFIIICFWITVVISTPYFITGETIARRDEEHTYLGLVDQQDILLLLAWLLGEASHDNSCLERIVCLTPDKSSKYLTVSSMIFKVAGYLRRWVPYSPRYVDQLHHLNEVAENGFSQSCHKYSCPTVPEL